MTTTRIASTIQLLIDLEPSLLSDLQQADSQEEIFRRLVAAGNRHDVDLDADDAADRIPVPLLMRNSMPEAQRKDVCEIIQVAASDEPPVHIRVLDPARIFASIATPEPQETDV